ncbi:MAG: sigma-70 family RNA polymerase sigma factor [Gemmataceae bacterium]|nr:sigma-70 family RNA polymerase sigma factor [Gemmataceae bacterium]
MLAMPRMSADLDAPLMRRIRRGSEAAFAELVQRHGPRLFGLLLRFCRDRHEAEDLTQEVFVRVFRACSRWKPSAKVATWLDRIAKNVARNAARGRSRRAWLGYVSAVEETECFEPPVLTPLEQSELAAYVRRAVAKLVVRHREALELQHFQDRSCADIAGAMNISPKATKCLLYRARQELRQLLVAESP